MGKQVDTSKLDALGVIRSAKPSNRQSLPIPPTPQQPPEPVPEPTPEAIPELTEQPPQGAVMPPAVEPVKEKEPPREESKRRRGKAQPEAEPDYKTLFLHEAMITARSGKTVYISQQHHNRILKILQVIGKNEVSLFAYIYNVLEHHFAEFQDDITELYESNIERIF
jgi:hypothetical protein